MQFKPIAERTNWPIISGFIAWGLAIFALGFSNTAYFALSGAAIALFICQVALNVRVRRA
jgi:hypothetical protein